MTGRFGGAARDHLSTEDGQGVISSFFGLLAFLVFLLVAVQLALYMFTASIVQTAAIDGASHGAGAAQAGSVAAAQNRARAVLGGLADDATVSGAIRSDLAGDVLTVTVRVDARTSVIGGLGLGTIERAANARVER